MKDLKAMLPTSLFGYRKDAVEDYVRRLESEIGIFEDRSKSSEKQMDQVNQELEKALAQLRNSDKEIQFFQSRNTALENDVRDLENQLRTLKDQLKQANHRFDQLKEETENSEYSPKQIQDALLRAQKTADTIVVDAQGQAQEIHSEAESYLLKKQQEGENLLSQAKLDAQKVTESMRKECEHLQQDIAGVKMSSVAYKRKMKGILQELLEVVNTIPEMEGISDTAPAVEKAEEKPAEHGFRVLKIN